MLHTTLRQLGLVSGRTILVIGLTMGAMTAWTSAAKADTLSAGGDVAVLNLPHYNIAFDNTGLTGSPDGNGKITAVKVGSLTAIANKSFDIKVSSAAATPGVLVGDDSGKTPVAYTLKIGSGSGSATASAVTGTDTAFYTGTDTEAAALIGKAYDVTIDTGTTDFRTQPAATYKETLLFSIAAH